MLGIILAITGSLTDEISFSLGKWAITHHKESPYTFGLMSWIGGLLCFAILLFTGVADWTFAVASLPFLIPRIVIEIFQAHIATKILAAASRSSIAFFMLLTVPILLVVDTIMGYTITLPQLIGIAVVLTTATLMLIKHKLDGKELPLILLSSVNAAISISLYKYSITNFNSIAAEQTIVIVFLVLFFTIASLQQEKGAFMKQFQHPLFIIQLLVRGLSVGLISFSYFYAAPSVINTAKKASGMIWATISGQAFFHEHHVKAKALGIICMVAGLLLIAR